MQWLTGHGLRGSTSTSPSYTVYVTTVSICSAVNWCHTDHYVLHNLMDSVYISLCYLRLRGSLWIGDELNEIWSCHLSMWYEADSFPKICTVKKLELTFVSFTFLWDVYLLLCTFLEAKNNQGSIEYPWE